ncbi:MAG TPA: NUDIX domain-containing protein [Stellaceae bacterium]|nr:NUDIX domain-containing protein [Stellaceae bacterium]
MNSPLSPPESVQILSQETPYQGFFRIDRYHLRHRLFAGGWSPVITREIFERGRAVGILLYDPDRDEVVLIEQFRLAAHLAGFPAWQIEIVAGIIDHAGEAPLAVARREAREEAGLELLDEPVFLHRYLLSPGGSTEVIDLFCGRVDASKAAGIHGLADEHEDIRVMVETRRRALTLLRTDRLQNGPTLLALHLLSSNAATLRRRWRPRARQEDRG